MRKVVLLCNDNNRNESIIMFLIQVQEEGGRGNKNINNLEAFFKPASVCTSTEIPLETSTRSLSVHEALREVSLG